jgi:hypothetical protein
MSGASSLRAALKRGALLAAANWPVILIDFTIESLYKFALIVPVAGGALMVAATAGGDVRAIVAEGLQPAADLVLAALSGAPIALVSFVLAVLLVAGGGGLVMVAIKSGSLAVLVESDRAAGAIERGAVRLPEIRRASAYRPELVLDAVRRFASRSAWLGLGLGTTYCLILIGWLIAVSTALELASSPRWAATWPLLILVATSAGGVAVAAANLVYDVLRVIVVSEDCQVRQAIRSLRSFVAHDARQILGIFGVAVLALLVGYAAAAPAAAVFTFVAWVPVAGLIALPLQIAGWLVQGLLFQYVSLSAVAAYQAEYRRFRDGVAPLRPTLIKGA